MRSLKNKFLLAITLTTITGLMVACTAMVIFNLRDYKSRIVQDLVAQATLMGRAVTPALQFNDPKSANVYLELMQDQPDVLEAAIYDERGKLFAGYVKGGDISRLRTFSDEQGLEIEGRSARYYRNIVFDGEIVGAVYIAMEYNLLAKLLVNVAIAAVAIVLAIIAASILSLYLQKNVIGPILLLSKLASQRAQSKDYSLRATRMSDDELGALSDAFNEMLDEMAKARASLQSSNAALKSEVEERRAAEIALKESEDNVLRLNAELEQRVLNRTAQLEVANKELESFSYSVSHDLRAPLRAIDGFSQALVEDYRDQLDETAKDYLNRVRAAAQKMGNLIDDLLKLSRVSRSDITLLSVDLSAMIKTIFEDLQSSDPARAVQVTITSGLHADCDPHLIKIALTNLASNAWKYTSKTERAEIEFGMRLSGNEAAFFIQDNGVGFDMAYAGKLFGAFQRLHSAGEFSGTGIGLATVKRVITRHGGRIWAEAAPGQGATFYFTLPSKEQSIYDTEGEPQNE